MDGPNDFPVLDHTREKCTTPMERAVESRRVTALVDSRAHPFVKMAATVVVEGGVSAKGVGEGRWWAQ